MAITIPLCTSMTTGTFRRTIIPSTRPWQHSRCASLTARCPCGVGSSTLPKMLAHRGTSYLRTPTSSRMKTKTLSRWEVKGYGDRKVTEINCIRCDEMEICLFIYIYFLVPWRPVCFWVPSSWTAIMVMALIWIFMTHWWNKRLGNV